MPRLAELFFLFRSVGADGEPLSDAELEWAVLCLEEAEERMSAMDFSTAAGILEGVLGRWVRFLDCAAVFLTS